MLSFINEVLQWMAIGGVFCFACLLSKVGNFASSIGEFFIEAKRFLRK